MIKNNSVVYKNLDVLEFEKYNYFYILKSTDLSRIGFLSNRLELLFNNGIDYYQLSTNPIYEEEAEKNRTYFASIGYQLDKLMVLLKMILNLEMKC